ncbi:MAG: hypothetical protein A2041_12320 [Bacteroidetes bacterium GWA2_31_9b]|nr:MAG: hypothetical protein A2041_12320 [Bacteroidetes bacterium GWA2_31_9b]
MRFSLTILLISIFMMLLGSKCDNSKSTTFCGIKDPVKNIEWLKTRVENADKIEVTKIVYNGQDYLSINPCPGCPDNMTEIFDCEGNRFCTIGGITGRNTCPSDFLEKSEKTLVLTQKSH